MDAQKLSFNPRGIISAEDSHLSIGSPEALVFKHEPVVSQTHTGFTRLTREETGKPPQRIRTRASTVTSHTWLKSSHSAKNWENLNKLLTVKGATGAYTKVKSTANRKQKRMIRSKSTTRGALLKESNPDNSLKIPDISIKGYSRTKHPPKIQPKNSWKQNQNASKLWETVRPVKRAKSTAPKDPHIVEYFEKKKQARMNKEKCRMLKPLVMYKPENDSGNVSELARYKKSYEEFGSVRALVQCDPENADFHVENVKLKLVYRQMQFLKKHMNAKVGLEEGNVKKLMEFLNGDLDPVYRVPIQSAIKNAINNVPCFMDISNDLSKRASPELDKSGLARLLCPKRRCTKDGSPKAPKIQLKEFDIGKGRGKCVSVLKEKKKQKIEAIKGYFQGNNGIDSNNISPNDRELVLEQIIVYFIKKALQQQLRRSKRKDTQKPARQSEENDDWLRRVSYWSEKLENIRKNRSYIKHFLHVGCCHFYSDQTYRKALRAASQPPL
eukprot:TRINITY_DN1421_c0_g2_i3.p1 TRINITY_DN1421_c0_g2~~TRINITY_DN1421_c0_g2_i3.p1  ORF type:complete len:497 (+),score=20.41 TRINITY_DN1421_c0_g2_i3:79-1569(+)